MNTNIFRLLSLFSFLFFLCSLVFAVCDISTPDLSSLSITYFVDTNTYHISVTTNILRDDIIAGCNGLNPKLLFQDELKTVFLMSDFKWNSDAMFDNNYLVFIGTAKSKALTVVNNINILNFDKIEEKYAGLSKFYLKINLNKDANIIDVSPVVKIENPIIFSKIANIMLTYSLPLPKEVVVPIESVDSNEIINEMNSQDNKINGLYFEDNFLIIALFLLVIIVIVVFLIMFLLNSKSQKIVVEKHILSQEEQKPVQEENVEEKLRNQAKEIKSKIVSIEQSFMKQQVDETTYRRLNEQYQLELNDIRVKLKNLSEDPNKQ
ncbi:MAG: hypothetical protein PHQ98_04715 [Candidatus ainarchaeum sp.]|nr:hypothetical protein [Candidatus ainarchaeum sp.]